MACTFIALFDDDASARRASDELSALPRIERTAMVTDVEQLIASTGLAPHEAHELRAGVRHGERLVVIEVSNGDPTTCRVLEATAGANLLIRAPRSPAPADAHRPRSAIEGIRSDMYIG